MEKIENTFLNILVVLVVCLAVVYFATPDKDIDSGWLTFSQRMQIFFNYFVK